MHSLKNVSEFYKQSKFNVEISNKNKWIIFNTFTNGMLELNEKYYEYYKKFCVPDEITKKKFLNYGIWIEKDINEIDKLSYIHHKNKFNDRSLSLTIKTTNNCNFLCTYCYQKHDNKLLKIDTVNSIIKWIDNEIIKNKIEMINIHWFGGEPLLNMDPILKIENHMQQKHKKVNFFSNLTTNGYLLNKHNIMKLKNTKIRTIQITLDGDEKQHNKSRILPSTQGTYKKIIENILLVINMWKDVHIILRLNVNKNNENIEKYLIELKKYNILSKKNVALHFNETKKFDINYTQENIFYNEIEEYSKSLLKIYKLLLKYNEKVPFYELKGYNCEFDKINTFLIEVDGTLYQCTSSEKEDIFKMGYINTEGLLILNEKNYYKKVLRSPFKAECLNCKVLPWCMGGCFFLETKKMQKCIPEKYILTDLIKLYYKEGI